MELMDDFKFSSDERLYQKAKEKARKIRGFYINLACYCIVIPCLIFINLKYSPGYYWFFFSMAGWGIGLVFHGFETFDWPFFSRRWEQQKIKEILEKEKFNKQ